ncbi:hypothetical protein PPO43_13965 [Saprospira sp. CCB-QB6]|uniref:DUF7793 family protein n=1 Tax=Saprospira sp. CCB-QB6 TaxID=3023936 RepID=UPI0023493E7C|nr:hypothetical protein [Saprospira sp. CCB-QB6]WCL81076.1 hypothetical protein PPO43_13965 [Saprospira sp. CCB-QB6]
MQKNIQSPIADIRQINEKMLYIEYLPTVKDIDKIDQHFKLVEEVFGRELLMLVDVRRVKTTNAKARRYMAKNNPVASAAAIVVNNGPSAIIGNFFLKFDSPPFPAKLFSQETEAKKWLDKILIEQE